MKIGMLLSSLGGSPLQAGLDRAFAQLGHWVEPYHEAHGYDLIVVWNQVSHDPTYVYPEFPSKCKTPIVFIDSAEYGWWLHLPKVSDPYKNTFSEGSLAHDSKSRAQQMRLKEFLQGRSFPYMIREMWKWMEWPSSYHPIDYPLYMMSECHEEPNLDEYVSRQKDLFMSWGLSHPWRKNITEELRRMTHAKSQMFNTEILVLEENGTPRMPQHEFFRKTREAKVSVSFDGYGSTSFRIMEVLVRCLLLTGPINYHQYKPMLDGVHCRKYKIENNDLDYISSTVCQELENAILDVEGSFNIYRAGYHLCHQYYSEQATAKYVLDVVERHDWSKPTPLDL